MATAVHTLNIPRSNSGASNDPFDVGELTVEASPSLSEGQSAPEFEVETLDGKVVRLADLQGKFVLLNFWATWCGECVAQVPELKAIYDDYRSDDRFEMLGLSLDESSNVLRDFVHAQEIAWPQAHLGVWSQTTLPSQFSASRIPSVFLIGPDGTLIAQGLRGPQIREEIENALR